MNVFELARPLVASHHVRSTLASALEQAVVVGYYKQLHEETCRLRPIRIQGHSLDDIANQPGASIAHSLRQSSIEAVTKLCGCSSVFESLLEMGGAHLVHRGRAGRWVE